MITMIITLNNKVKIEIPGFSSILSKYVTHTIIELNKNILSITWKTD